MKEQFVRRVALDTMAASHLCDGSLRSRAVLHTLRSRVKQGTFKLVATWPLIEELAGLFDSNPTLYRRIMREVARLSRGRLLNHGLVRVPLEVRRRSRLRAREAFLPMRESRQILAAALRNAKAIKGQAAVVVRAKQKYEQGEAEEKAAFWREAEGTMDREQGCTAFVRNRDAVIDDVCRNALREHRERFGLPVAEGEWPAPREVPTLRADMAFHVARLYLVGLEAKGKGKIDGNDLYDNAHFADAVYSDVLVTDDKRLHRIAGEAGNTRVHLQRYEDFAIDVLSPSGARRREPTSCGRGD